MDYRKLRYFCAVAEEHSLHQASERLRISQPALTRAIQDLEAEFGARLLVRHSRGVDLTREGEVLLEHAHGLIRHVEAARKAVAATGAEPRGLVSVGVPPSLSVLLLAPVAERLSAQWPDIVLNFHERLMPGLLSMLQEDRLDVAIVGNPPPQSGLKFKLLVKEDVYLVSRSDSSMAGNVEIGQLRHLPSIVSGSGVGTFSWFEEAVRDKSILRSIHLRAEGAALSTALVRAGLGCAVLPRSTLCDVRDDPALRFSRIEELKLKRFLATSMTRPASRATTVVTAMLLEQFARLAANGVFVEPR